MSASPFKTIDEFNGVLDGPTEGAIYTFAHTPSLNAIALVASVAIFIWFLFRTYATHHNVPKIDKSLNSLSMLITVGLLSLVSAEFRQPSRPAGVADTQVQRVPLRESLPVALLGLTGIGATRRSKAGSRRRQHTGTRRFR